MKVLYFSTPACGPCRFFYPILLEYLNSKEIALEKIDLSEEQNFQFKEDYGLNSVPTVVVLKEGVEFGRVVGAKLKEVKELV